MKILFQNENFISVDKEAGWLTTPARFGDKDPRPVLGLELQKQFGRQIFPVHRLDFEVSGLVLFALSARAHSEANSQFENKKVQKAYQSLTENLQGLHLDPGATFEWKARILRGKKRAYESPHGKPSLTLARFIGDRDGLLRWELRPVTGRSHQLRFDLARHGFPIAGDVLYGAQAWAVQDRIELRSVELEFLNSQFCQKWGLPSKIQGSPLFYGAFLPAQKLHALETGKQARILLDVSHKFFRFFSCRFLLTHFLTLSILMRQKFFENLKIFEINRRSLRGQGFMRNQPIPEMTSNCEAIFALNSYAIHLLNLEEKSMKQISMSFLKNYKKEFGGSLLAGKRKERRPLSTKNPVHLVLRSDFPGVFNPGNRSLEELIRKIAARFHVKVYDFSLNWSHIHCVIRIRDRKNYNAFIRALTGTIARKIQMSCKFTGKIFSLRPFTRVLKWGKDFRNALSYQILNQLEALGLVKRVQVLKKRKIRKRLSECAAKV